MKKSRIHIGTSGWQYKHWKGKFYPEGLKASQEFDFYTHHFETVEINNSFYRLPDAKTFKNWREAAPKNFLFSVKGGRFITHLKKLKVTRQSIRKFFSRAEKLNGKLGPILFQLPPRWKINVERFEDFLTKLPEGYHYSFEFRDHSWYNKKIFNLLKKYKMAFCIYELEHHLSPIEVTTNFVYIRLHGPGAKYQGNYSDSDLKSWALRCKHWLKEGKDVFVYFDNDQNAYAAHNAERLKELVPAK